MTVHRAGGTTGSTLCPVADFAGRHSTGDCFDGDELGLARDFVPFDSFSAAPLLARLCAPLLLTHPGELPVTTRNLLDRVRRSADDLIVHVFGGSAAVSPQVAAQL